MKLSIDRIIVSKDNPRKRFDEEGLRRLGESIQSHGQLQPILVRPVGQNYELLVGERRLRAIALVGLGSIDAEIRDVDDVTAMEFRLIENTQREDLTDAEKGDAVLNLWANYDKYKTIKDVAEAINTPYSTVKNLWVAHSRKLSPKLRGMLGDTFTNTHGRYLLKYPHATQNDLADVSIKHNLTKRQLVNVTKKFDATPNADLDKLAQEAQGIKKIEISVDKIPKEVLEKIEEEKKQFAKVQKLKPRKKPSKPITKEDVLKKQEAKKKKIANSSFKFEKVKISTGTKKASSPLKQTIKPMIVHNETTPDYSLCKCAVCPLFAKHCKGRCWT